YGIEDLNSSGLSVIGVDQPAAIERSVAAGAVLPRFCKLTICAESPCGCAAAAAPTLCREQVRSVVDLCGSRSRKELRFVWCIYYLKLATLMGVRSFNDVHSE